MRVPRLAPLALLTASAVTLVSCNIFDPLDKPRGDEQLLSAARACFDQGDLECAQEYYAEVSGDQAEAAASESAFAILAEAGVDFSAFLGAFGGGDGITGLNALAEKMIDKISDPKPGPELRLKIFGAFQKTEQITSPELKGLVRFATSLAFISEILAEIGGSDGFAAADFVTGPTACKASSTPACAILDDCKASGSAHTTGTTFSLTDADAGTDSAKVNSTTPTLAMIDAGINQVIAAVGDDELNLGGSFGSTASAFTQFAGQTMAADDGRCYRMLLLQQGLGE